MQAHSYVQPYAHPAIAIPLQIVLTVLVVTFSVSLLGGWWSLARRYRTQKPMPKGSFLISGSLRYVVGYENVIRAASDADGLYLRFWPRLAHPPLFIPWADVRLKKPYRFIRRSQTMLLGQSPAIPFSVRQRDVERLTKNQHAASEAIWPRLDR